MISRERISAAWAANARAGQRRYPDWPPYATSDLFVHIARGGPYHPAMHEPQHPDGKCLGFPKTADVPIVL